jgi:splicing factor 1
VVQVRRAEELRKERQEVIERMIKLNPLFRPPQDYVRMRPHRRLYIPVKEFPSYNFIGLIIGE